MEYTATTFLALASIERSHKELCQRSKEDIVHQAPPLTATGHNLNNASTVTIEAPQWQEAGDRDRRQTAKGMITSLIVGVDFNAVGVGDTVWLKDVRC